MKKKIYIGLGIVGVLLVAFVLYGALIGLLLDTTNAPYRTKATSKTPTMPRPM